jgi:hypothetical protein
MPRHRPPIRPPIIAPTMIPGLTLVADEGKCRESILIVGALYIELVLVPRAAEVVGAAMREIWPTIGVAGRVPIIRIVDIALRNNQSTFQEMSSSSKMNSSKLRIGMATV